MRNETFILYAIFQDPKKPNRVTHPNTNQTAKIWSLELENTRSLWKISIESEKKYQNIRITATILGNEKFILL